MSFKLFIYSVLISVLFLFSLSSTFALSDTSIDFLSGGGSQTISLDIEGTQITSISFDITGESSSSSYPSEVYLDIGNDGTQEWNYDPYVSQTPISINSLLDVISLQDSNYINFQSDMGVDDIGITYGNLDNNEFSKATTQQSGDLGILTIEDISEETTLSLISSEEQFHAFLPRVDNLLGTAGFYVAQGGATYYCNSNHSFYLSTGCDLTPSQAFNSDHLAASGDSEFRESYTINSPIILNAINAELESCSSAPCSIDLNIESATQGRISLENFEVTYNTPQESIPASISINENQDSYSISITPGSDLKDVSYFYGEMPQVIIAPVIASDDSIEYSSRQTTLMNNIQNELASDWDIMTENKYPLDFQISMDVITLDSYTISDNNFVQYQSEAEEKLEELIPDTTIPSIVIILDINDYFSSNIPSNSVSQFSEYDPIISTIYMNGFTNSVSTTQLENYDSEIFINILLHELAHSFIHYNGDRNYFYENHPQSYSTSSSIDTEPISNSPINEESYYELYSILNQFRPYLSDSDVGGSPQLSSLDKMLMGTLNSYGDKKYNLYSGTLSETSTKLEMSSINLEESIDAKPFYDASKNFDWWNILKDSQRSSQGTSTSFSVQKSSQESRALWVFANDNHFTNNFRVFSNNAESKVSILSTIELPPHISDIEPSGELAAGTTNTTIRVTTSVDSLCRISTNSNQDFVDMDIEMDTEDDIDHTYLVLDLENGSSYEFYIRCNDIDLNIANTQDEVVSFSVEETPQEDTDPDSDIGNDDDNNNEDSNQDNDSDSNSGGNSGDSGGSGGDSNDRDDDEDNRVQRNDLLDSLIEKEKNPQRCYSEFNYSTWSTCENGMQERNVFDLNSCVEDSIQTRTCNIALSEEETQKLNAKNYTLQNTGNKYYQTRLSGSYNELIVSDKKLNDSEFILVDNETGDEYLGTLFEEDGNKYYYSLEKVYGAESLTSEVERANEVYVGNPILDHVMKGIAVLLLVGFVIFIVRFILKL